MGHLEEKKRVKKYIEFRERDPLPKTKRWDVVNVRTNIVVGEIQWYGAFRKYVFFPEDDMLFDSGCLRLISEFLDEHKNDRV